MGTDLRTSSAHNVGADKGSEKQQLEAIETFARTRGHRIVGTYRDQAVNGADAMTS